MVNFATVRLVAMIDEVTVRVGIFVKGRIQKGNYFPWMQTLIFSSSSRTSSQSNAQFVGKIRQRIE